MVMKLFNKRRLTWLFMLAFVFSITACSAEEKEIKNKIIDGANNANGKDITVDIGVVSKRKVLRMCIQTPYLIRRRPMSEAA